MFPRWARLEVAYLFDTDAISEVWRPKPCPGYLHWLATVPLEHQYTSAVTVGELYKGAYRSANPDRYLTYIEERLLPHVIVLPCDVAVAKTFGELRSVLELMGQTLEDADLQIAATAVYHGLELVTGNVAHFERVPGLSLNRILANARKA